MAVQHSAGTRVHYSEQLMLPHRLETILPMFCIPIVHRVAKLYIILNKNIKAFSFEVCNLKNDLSLLRVACSLLVVSCGTNGEDYSEF
jgi:hypothetical protein